jgi:hypothetical protein
VAYPPNVVIIPPGGTPAGAFVSAAVVGSGRPPGILADAVDATTGEITSLFVGHHPVDAAFVHQCAVRAESGAAVSGGQRFDEIRKNVDDTDKRLAFEARRIADPLVRRGFLELVELDTNTTDSVTGELLDQGNVFIQFRNRLTNEKLPVRR